MPVYMNAGTCSPYLAASSPIGTSRSRVHTGLHGDMGPDRPRSGLRLSREEDMVGLLINLEPNLAVLLREVSKSGE
jgi:hypothetical protein